jgi:uncharacterized protein YbjT (DUF2867 family)
MYVVLGATGHIGSAVVAKLAGDGANVVAVTRSKEKAQRCRDTGATAAVLDIADVAGLRGLFRKAKRALLINPPADVSGDIDIAESKSVDHIIAALEGSELERVVAESTYGAQPCKHCGDLGILFEFEKKLQAQAIPTSLIRGAYYFSNWDASLRTASHEDILYSMFPAAFVLPMVAPADIGAIAADLLSSEQPRLGIHYVEGPARYCANDVAKAFSVSLEKSVNVVVIPPDRWEEAFRKLGFSEQAAASYARMTRLTLDEVELPERPLRGRKSLQSYVEDLVRSHPHAD